jgi:hypothetical protein
VIEPDALGTMAAFISVSAVVDASAERVAESIEPAASVGALSPPHEARARDAPTRAMRARDCFFTGWLLRTCK